MLSTYKLDNQKNSFQIMWFDHILKGHVANKHNKNIYFCFHAT
jgi:hypothetical protein